MLWIAHGRSKSSSGPMFLRLRLRYLPATTVRQQDADSSRWRGRDVLEIGCGVGTDTLRFARAGARVTAVDLTEAAIALTRQRLVDEELTASVVQADAEDLPFADASFDLVYSWGVLH